MSDDRDSVAADGAPEVLLEMQDVHAGYHGDIMVLNGVSLKARRGQVTGIIGPNGAGKSTALKTLYGFLAPMRGDIAALEARVSRSAPEGDSKLEIGEPRTMAANEVHVSEHDMIEGAH